MDFSDVHIGFSRKQIRRNRLHTKNLSTMLVKMNYQPQINSRLVFEEKKKFQKMGKVSKIVHFLRPYFFSKRRS